MSTDEERRKIDRLAREEREQREQRFITEAKRNQKCITYIDSDGCEVTVTPGGHAFYNASDWY